MVANLMGMDSLWVVLIALVVLFGGSQLPKLAKNAGEAMREFRKVGNDVAPSEVAVGPATPPTPVLAPQAPAVAAAASGEDRVTLTRSELDALLADREARARQATQS